MKLNDVVKMFDAGQPVLVVEYRSSKAERIRWRDKESHNTLEAPILRHSCEAADGTPYVVNERVPDTFKETEFKSLFKRGDKVVLKFTAMNVERGIQHFQGALESLVS
jgi:hypothetical protein